SPLDPSADLDSTASESSNALRSAAIQLQQSLAQRTDDGEIWSDYLAPAEIVRLIDSGQATPEKLADRLRNYRGVAANPELAWLASLPGFAETRVHLESQAALSVVRERSDSANPTETPPRAP